MKMNIHKQGGRGKGVRAKRDSVEGGTSTIDNSTHAILVRKRWVNSEAHGKRSKQCGKVQST